MNRFVSLAFKNVFRQKKRSFTLGVNYAVVAFILVMLLSFSRGAAVNIADNLARATAGHITVSGQFASGGKIYNGLLRSEDIVEAIERTEPERRQAAIDAWKRYVVTVDVGLLHLIQLAQNHIEAGITSAQAWRECPAY
mgnify:CR=1 FL=1